MSVVRCPICGQPFELAASPTPPFCSRRCKQVDLGRWLGEEYGLPYESAEDESQETEGGRSPDV